MTGHLYWASANFQIAADIELPHEIRMVATGDFSGAGSAVLRGALSRITGMPVPIRLDASGITAISGDAAAALTERMADPVRPLTVETTSRAAASVLGTARIPRAARNHRPSLGGRPRAAPEFG